MSGIASFCFSLYEHAKGKAIRSRAFFVVGVICLLVGFDAAWQDEHRNSEVLIAEKSGAVSEVNFWKEQSYEKDSVLRQRDSLLAQNYTALTGEQAASTKTQQSLAQLSNKILDLNKPEPLKQLPRAGEIENIGKGTHAFFFLVLRNKSLTPVRFTLECSSAFNGAEAQIARSGGTQMQSEPKLIAPNKELFEIDSPPWTQDNPLIIVLHTDESKMPNCSFALLP